MTCSVISGSSMVWNCKFFVFLISFQFMFASTGMSIVCNEEFFLSEVKELILFHINITCSIFCMFIIVEELAVLFSMFMPEALCIRCCTRSSFAFVVVVRRLDLACLSFLFSSAKLSQSMLIGEDNEDR